MFPTPDYREPAILFATAGFLNLSNCYLRYLILDTREGGPLVIVK